MSDQETNRDEQIEAARGRSSLPITDDTSINHSFQNDGVVGPISILTPKEARDIYTQYNHWKESLPNHQVTGDLRFKPHLYLPFIHRIAHDPTLVRAVQQALDTKHVLLWSSDLNIKEPHTDCCFLPHQDSTYAGLQPASKCLTAWVALSDPVGPEQGCLYFWKGSHIRGQLPHVEEPSTETNMLSRGQHVDLVEYSQNDKSVAIPSLRGGQATLHSFYTVHASGPNHSSQPRVGLALRYMDASVVQTGKTRECVTQISGRPQHDGFDLEPILPTIPSEEHVQIGKQAHVEAMKREAANYFQGTSTLTGYDEPAV